MAATIIKKTKTLEEAVTERTILIENGYTIVYESSTDITYYDATKHGGGFEEFEGGHVIVGVK